LYTQGRYREALPLGENGLRLGEREFELGHPNAATLLRKLAMLSQAQDRFAEAERLNQRALAIDETALGTEHRNVAAGLQSYAALLRKTEREGKAEEMEARAKVIRAKLYATAAGQMSEEEKPHLEAELATRVESSDTSKKNVRHIQKLLTELGYNTGPADGILGVRTRTSQTMD
jgi:tetratricopeptide (TPR) repeat protein